MSAICKRKAEWPLLQDDNFPSGVQQQTICKLHSRDFSDCFRHHRQHPILGTKSFSSQFQFQQLHTSRNKLTLPGKQIQEPIKEITTVDRPVKPKSTMVNEIIVAAPVSLVKGNPAEITTLVQSSVRGDPSTLSVVTMERLDRRLDRSRSDPMSSLGADIMRQVMALLDARSLARCGSASKDWKSLAHSDDFWLTKISSCDDDSGEPCTNLWAGKQHIPARALLPGLSRLAAYSISLHDSQRCSITVDDLCEFQWEFRFKDTVPQYWLDLDPSKRGEPAMQRYFHKDGSQTATPDDPVWGGHESCFTIVENSEMERFVRINHWPHMSVSRTPDWGWELHNTFHVYTSLPKQAIKTIMY